jgi:hypothetical protein
MDGPTKQTDISDRLIGHKQLTHGAFVELLLDVAQRSDASSSRLRELLTASAYRIRSLNGGEA